jgi:hypothetical protein
MLIGFLMLAEYGSEPQTGVVAGCVKVIGLGLVLLVQASVQTGRVDRSRELLMANTWRLWSGRFTEVGRRGAVTLVLWPAGIPEPGPTGVAMGTAVVVRADVLLGSADTGLLRGTWDLRLAGDPRREAVVHVPGTPLVLLTTPPTPAPPPVPHRP